MDRSTAYTDDYKHSPTPRVLLATLGVYSGRPFKVSNVVTRRNGQWQSYQDSELAVQRLYDSQVSSESNASDFAWSKLHK